MSIQTEIDRIKNNVTSALSAISAKGVDVPTDAKSDDLSSLISSIVAGGGSVGVSHIKISSNSTTYSIPNDCSYVAVVMARFSTTPTINLKYNGELIENVDSHSNKSSTFNATLKIELFLLPDVAAGSTLKADNGYGFAVCIA